MRAQPNLRRPKGTGGPYNMHHSVSARSHLTSASTRDERVAHSAHFLPIPQLGLPVHLPPMDLLPTSANLPPNPDSSEPSGLLPVELGHFGCQCKGRPEEVRRRASQLAQWNAFGGRCD